MWTNYIRSKYNATYQPTLHDWLKMTMGEEGITHKEYVHFFIKEIEEIVHFNHYIIEDQKKFKDEITTFIYTLSDNSKHGH